VPAVTEHVHRDKGDEDQHPEPVCRKPCHDCSPSGVSSRFLVNTSSGRVRCDDHEPSSVLARAASTPLPDERASARRAPHSSAALTNKRWCHRFAMSAFAQSPPTNCLKSGTGAHDHGEGRRFRRAPQRYRYCTADASRPFAMNDPSQDEALKQEIARRSYVRFCDRGCAHGEDVDDWLEAEREVLESRKSETATDKQATARPRFGGKANRR
jgi:hypothetical protein